MLTTLSFSEVRSKISTPSDEVLKQLQEEKIGAEKYFKYNNLNNIRYVEDLLIQYVLSGQNPDAQEQQLSAVYNVKTSNYPSIAELVAKRYHMQNASPPLNGEDLSFGLTVQAKRVMRELSKPLHAEALQR